MTARHVPTEESRKQVEACSGWGLRHEHIATLLGITDKTLRRAYRKELDLGKAKASSNIGKTIYEQAIKGDRTMLIWWSKTQMGWRETVQVTTPPGEALVSATGEAEYLAAYHARLKAAAEGDTPEGADPDPAEAVDPGG